VERFRGKVAVVTGTVLRIDGGFTAHDPGYSFERA
jgi:hypothetical protein